MCGNLNPFFPIFTGGDGSNHTECSKSGIDVSCNICNNYDTSTECPTTTNNCKDYSENNSENNVTIENVLGELGLNNLESDLDGI
jgi:hypothetical protein